MAQKRGWDSFDGGPETNPRMKKMGVRPNPGEGMSELECLEIKTELAVWL